MIDLMGIAICSQCGEAKHLYARGLCGLCYNYEQRTGRPRPPDLRPKGPFACSNCGDTRKYAKGLCHKCYTYQWRHGEPRPRGYGQIDVERMERMLLDGYSLRHISRETGYDWRTIRKYLAAYSPETRKQIAFKIGRGNTQITYTDTMEIFRLRLGGATLQAIADRFGVNKSTISRICKNINQYDPSALLQDAPEPELAVL